MTGSRREIGRAIALGLAGVGARLAIHHAGTAEESSDAAAVVRDIGRMGGAAAAFGQDFGQDDAGRRLAAAVTAWAQVDILVLNASISCVLQCHRQMAADGQPSLTSFPRRRL